MGPTKMSDTFYERPRKVAIIPTPT